ncbi:MAG: hypothetical protein K2L49_06820 [Muribaculaceae bacterium]|nr:hypothetical protein [Muribaculaceae bacterium]
MKILISIIAGLLLTGIPLFAAVSEANNPLPASLEVDTACLYAVDWEVTVCRVAKVEENDMAAMFASVLSRADCVSDFRYGVYMHELKNLLPCDIDSLESSMERIALPEGYGWFGGMRDDNTYVLGIKDIRGCFSGFAVDASLWLEPLSDNALVIHFAFDNGEPASMTSDFERYTAANIGNVVVMEINGIFVCAPTIYAAISSGRIALDNLPVSVINKLFSMTVAEMDIQEK